jgi:hypothetical protein
MNKYKYIKFYLENIKSKDCWVCENKDVGIIMGYINKFVESNWWCFISKEGIIFNFLQLKEILQFLEDLNIKTKEEREKVMKIVFDEINVKKFERKYE